MRKLFIVLLGVAVSLPVWAGNDATAVFNTGRDDTPSAPYNLYVEPGTHSCTVSWEDDENSAWNLRYRLYSEEPAEPVLLHSLTGSAYTGSYADITLPAPWSGTNLRGGQGIIYFKNKSTGYATDGNLTYTIPEGYSNDVFTLMIKTGTAYGSGNFTVSTPQTAAVGHNFSGGETFYWLVTASSGEKITVTSTDANYSPDIALIAVYSGDATDMGLRAHEWTNVNNLDKTEYTIEGLEIETDYEVQVQAIGDNGILSDWTRPDVFTTLDEEPFVPVVHILGEINDQAWSPFVGTKMEYDAEQELYTATVYVEAERTFGFTTEIDDNEDMGGWNYIEPYRFGPVSNGDFWLQDEYLGQHLALTFDNYGAIKVLSTGEYNVTVSLEQNYIIIGKVAPEPPAYLRGDVDDDGDVDIDDVTRLIDVVLGKDVTYNADAADCNTETGDGSVDIDDVTALINRVLTGSWD